MRYMVVHGDGTENRARPRGKEGRTEERESLWKVNLFWKVLLFTWAWKALSPGNIVEIINNLF